MFDELNEIIFEKKKVKDIGENMIWADKIICKRTNIIYDFKFVTALGWMDWLCLPTNAGWNPLAVLLPTCFVFKNLETGCITFIWGRSYCPNNDNTLGNYKSQSFDKFLAHVVEQPIFRIPNILFVYFFINFFVKHIFLRQV